MWGKLSPGGLSRAEKYKAWDDVHKFCVAIGVHFIDSDHVRDAWKSWKKQRNQKKALAKKTGQGLNNKTATTKVDELIDDILTEAESSKYNKVIVMIMMICLHKFDSLG